MEKQNTDVFDRILCENNKQLTWNKWVPNGWEALDKRLIKSYSIRKAIKSCSIRKAISFLSEILHPRLGENTTYGVLGEPVPQQKGKLFVTFR